MAPPTIGRRLPVSCEPCRKRKIKCTRNRPPCDTCLKRGLGPADCFYLGQPRHNFTQFSGDPPSLAQERLIKRMRDLEDLLQRHVGSQATLSFVQQDEPVSPPTSNGTTSSSPLSNNRSLNMGLTEPSTDPMAQMVQNVGSLHISSSGHVRFEPRSSTLNSQVAQRSVQDYAEELNTSAASYEEKPHGFPFMCEAPPSRKELLGRLPPGQYCDTLKDVYFRVFSSLFHVLHDPTFEAEYRQFRQDPNSVQLSWLALLYVVLAIAVNGLDDDSPLLSDLGRETSASANINVLAARYRRGAMQCLAADGFMERYSIRSLQALVLLIYALNHASQPSWVLLGVTHHIAIAMGCHLDPDHFGLGLLQGEERRRCWAGLVMLHMIQKINFRNLDEQRLSRRVRLPLDANDEDLVDGAEPPLQPPRGPTQMSYILFKFRLYDIALAICDEIFASDSPSPSVIAKLDREIAEQQAEWNARYASDSLQEPLPDHHVAHMHVLFGYSHQLCLLLHRPALNRYLSGEINSVTQRSRDKCLEAAKGLLSIHRHLVESPQFAPYKWYTGGLASFHAFHAVVVLVAILLNSNNNCADEKIEGIAGMVSDSLRVFKLLAGRSTMCEKAVPILKKLIEMISHRSPYPTHDVPYNTASSVNSTAAHTPSTSEIEILRSHLETEQQPPVQQQQQPQQQGQGQGPVQAHQVQQPYAISTPPLDQASSTHGVSHCDDAARSTFPSVPMVTEAEAMQVQAQLDAQYWVWPSRFSWENWGFLMTDANNHPPQKQHQHGQSGGHTHTTTTTAGAAGAAAAGSSGHDHTGAHLYGQFGLMGQPPVPD
ncbi:hypothetical protein VTO42DRAFT_4309 [Malbranchea cinnamomea]